MAIKKLGESPLPEEVLSADYEQAEKVFRARIGKEGVYFAKALSTAFIPYTGMDRAFLRITGVNSRVCCGPASFEMYHVIFQAGDTEIAALEVDSKVKGERILAAVKNAAPKIIIGKTTSSGEN